VQDVGMWEKTFVTIAILAVNLGISRQLAALYHTRLLAGRVFVHLDCRGLYLIGYPERTRA